MAPTHDLKRVLQSAAETHRPAVDPAADLARAQSAARARNRRRFRAGLAGVAAAAVATVGAVVVLDDGEPAGPSIGASVSPTIDPGVQLVSKQLDATPYTFDLTPKGWSVEAQNPYGVTIVPDDGSVSSDPDVFTGKLVIMFDANRPTGRVIEHDGRTFWTTGDSGYTTVATRTADGEPAGVVRIQYPRDTGWDESSMVAFLASVHVGPGARPGQG